MNVRRIKRIPHALWYRASDAYGRFQRIQSRCAVRFSGRRKESRAILFSLKDKYKGGRCFILGNGPSLTVQDLEMLRDEVTFASNRIFNIFPQTAWRPTYYAIGDRTVAISQDVQEQLNAVPCQMKFFIEQHFVQAHYKQLDAPAVFLFDKWNKQGGEYLPYFSTDLTRCVCMLGTVTFMLMQVAVWMGFTEIYLLGCDNKYQFEVSKDGTVTENGGVQSYFAGGETSAQKTVGRTWETNLVYAFAETYSRSHGFRIYNATRGGYLEIFERKNLDDVLASGGGPVC